MKWKRLPIKQFDSFAIDWDRAAARAAPSAPFLRSAFIRPLLKHFSDGSEALVAGYAGGEVRVAAILRKARPGIWETFQPSQMPLGALVIAERDPDLPQLLQGMLGAAPGLSLSLGLTQVDPLVVPRPAERVRLQTLDYIETAWVEIDRPFEAYWEGRGKNLRHNIRKQRSKLDEQGIRTRLDTVTRPQDVVDVLRDYGSLESAGWKASGGTAIHPDNAQGRFYRDMLEAYCAEGNGRLYRYWFGDRLAAVDLCITSEDTLVILKTTYDESQQSFSPAFLMRHEAFNDLFREGRIRRIEFYGKLMDWHKRWTEHSRRLYHVNYYRWQWLQQLKEKRARLQSPAAAAQPANAPGTPAEPAA